MQRIPACFEKSVDQTLTIYHHSRGFCIFYPFQLNPICLINSRIYSLWIALNSSSRWWIRFIDFEMLFVQNVTLVWSMARYLFSILYYFRPFSPDSFVGSERQTRGSHPSNIKGPSWNSWSGEIYLPPKLDMWII